MEKYTVHTLKHCLSFWVRYKNIWQRDVKGDCITWESAGVSPWTVTLAFLNLTDSPRAGQVASQSRGGTKMPQVCLRKRHQHRNAASQKDLKIIWSSLPPKAGNPPPQRPRKMARWLLLTHFQRRAPHSLLRRLVRQSQLLGSLSLC